MNTARSKLLFSHAKDITPGGVHSPVRAFRSVGREPFVVERAAGAFLYDVDGNKYVDYINSWGPMVLGHSHPKVMEALKIQLEKGTSYGACCEQEIILADTIIKEMPSVEQIRFVNSGTEACMSALRLARGFTKRKKIIKFAGCYHGHSDFLLVQAGSGVLTLGIPDGQGVSPEITRDTLTAQFNHIETVEDLFRQSPNEIAAVIVEPVIGNCGLILPRENFLQELRKMCDHYKALLIFDEVMTGFRVHPQGAQKLYNVVPDLTTLGKVIGGGLPVGAYGGRKDIMSLIAPEGPVYQAGTLSGNPLAMVAGKVTIDEWLKPGVFETTAGIAKTIVQAINELAMASNIPIQTSSVGTMFGFFFSDQAVTDYASSKRSNLDLFRRFFGMCLDRGVFFAPSQFEAGFVSSAHGGEALKNTLDVLTEVFPILCQKNDLK